MPETVGRFEATITAWRFWEFYDAPAALVDETRFRFNADSLSASAVDPANVGMVVSELSSDAFDTFDAAGGCIGVPLDPIGDVIDSADGDERLAVGTGPGKEYRLAVGGYEFTDEWLDPKSLRKEPSIPTDLDLPATVVIDSDVLYREVMRADIVDDHITLAVDADAGEFVIEADGDKGSSKYRAEAGGGVDIPELAPARSLFTLDYLKDFVRAFPPEAEVRLRLGEEYPLHMAYDIADGAGSVEYYLAPRIGGDD